MILKPGATAASVNPKKKRVAIRPAGFWVAPIQHSTIAQMILPDYQKIISS
jgi:hypothetical protein